MNLKIFIGYQTEPAMQEDEVAEECPSQVSDVLYNMNFFG